MIKRYCFIGIAFIIGAGNFLRTTVAHADDERLTLTQPSRDGTTAGCRVNAQGRAKLEPGEHVWAFAARKNFADGGLVWLQGEIDVDPASTEFSMPIPLGVGDDIGSSFRISVAIVDDATHTRLRSKFLEMMTTNRHLPVAFPTVKHPPKHRIVKKVDHDGC